MSSVIKKRLSALEQRQPLQTDAPVGMVGLHQHLECPDNFARFIAPLYPKVASK